MTGPQEPQESHIADPAAEPAFEPRLEYSTPEELQVLNEHYTSEAIDGTPTPRHDAEGYVLDDQPDAPDVDGDRPYDPTAEYGDPGWREPESQEEADARTAYLDAERSANPPSPPVREPTEVEDAYVDATVRGWHADMAHDPDPEAWAEARRLEALMDLAPLPPEPEPSLENTERDDTETDDTETDGAVLDDGPDAEVRDELVAVVDRESLIFDPAAEGGFRSMTDDEHDEVLAQVRASQPQREYDDEEPEP